jgi:hypothetical protein
MPKLLSALVGVSMLGLAGAASAGEPVNLTTDQLDIVTAGVSLTGGASTAFTGGIGTSTNSSATTTTSATAATNGGTVGAATLASFVLAASPPGS